MQGQGAEGCAALRSDLDAAVPFASILIPHDKERIAGEGGRVGQLELDSFINIEGVGILYVKADTGADDARSFAHLLHFRVALVDARAQLGVAHGQHMGEVIFFPVEFLDIACFRMGPEQRRYTQDGKQQQATDRIKRCSPMTTHHTPPTGFAFTEVSRKQLCRRPSSPSLLSFQCLPAEE